MKDAVKDTLELILVFFVTMLLTAGACVKEQAGKVVACGTSHAPTQQAK